MTPAPARSLAEFLRRPPSIRLLIVCLVGLISLPLIGLIVRLEVGSAQLRRSMIELDRLGIVHQLSYLVDRELAAVRGSLTGLSTSPDLSVGNMKEFGRHASALVGQPQVQAIQVYDRRGSLHYSSVDGPTGADVLDDGSPLLIKVFSGQVVISGIVSGDHPRAPYFLVLVPVRRDDSVIYALVARLDPSTLNRVFVDAGIKPEWVSAIVDDQGRFLARSLSPDSRVGQLARPELGAAARGKAESGEFENVTLEGVTTTNSFFRSRDTGWTSVVAVPKEHLIRPLYDSIRASVMTGLIVLATSLMMATWLARRIARPIGEMRRAAIALVDGKPMPPLSNALTETIEVGNAFEFASSKSAQLSAIVAASGDAILSVDPNGVILFWNPEAERLFGYSEGDIKGGSFRSLFSHQRGEEVAEQLLAVCEGKSVRFDTKMNRRDGTCIDVSLNISPIRSLDGSVTASSVIVHDVSERRAAELFQRLVMRELTHRSKNLLAIISSMATQTARSSADIGDFSARFTRRLQGLAASHDLLVAENWAGASLSELVRKHLGVFIADFADRIDLNGPAVTLNPRATQSLGLALHELATNSVKYGSLSVPSGLLAVRWSIIASSDGEELAIEWIERSGPSVVQPARKGFGHFVIDRMLSQSLNGAVKIDWASSGFAWTFTVPVDEVTEDGDIQPEVGTFTGTGAPVPMGRFGQLSPP